MRKKPRPSPTLKDESHAPNLPGLGLDSPNRKARQSYDEEGAKEKGKKVRDCGCGAPTARRDDGALICRECGHHFDVESNPVSYWLWGTKPDA